MNISVPVHLTGQYCRLLVSKTKLLDEKNKIYEP